MSKIKVDDVPYLLINAISYPSVKDVQDLMHHHKSTKVVARKEEKRNPTIIEGIKRKIIRNSKVDE